MFKALLMIIALLLIGTAGLTKLTECVRRAFRKAKRTRTGKQRISSAAGWSNPCTDAEDLFCDDAEDDEDDAEARSAEERKHIEKEIARLERCLEGMYTRRDRMLYTYGCMNAPKGSSAKAAAMAKLEKTKAWRGLEFDIRYTERHIEMLTADLEDLD